MAANPRRRGPHGRQIDPVRLRERAVLDEGGEPEPSNGASGTRLGTTTQADGARQVTYAGQPLYTYVGDKQPGEANGNGLKDSGLNWTALKGSGAPAG